MTLCQVNQFCFEGLIVLWPHRWACMQIFLRQQHCLDDVACFRLAGSLPSETVPRDGNEFNAYFALLACFPLCSSLFLLFQRFAFGICSVGRQSRHATKVHSTRLALRIRNAKMRNRDRKKGIQIERLNCSRVFQLVTPYNVATKFH